MARSAASIQAEITILEARVQSAGGTVSSVTADGTGVTYADVGKLTERLDFLYMQLDRISGAAPMLVRGRVKGL